LQTNVQVNGRKQDGEQVVELQRQPAECEQRHDNHQHLYHLTAVHYVIVAS